MTRTSSREIISTRQQKIVELARMEPKLTLSTLAHHIDTVWLAEAYRRTRQDGAVGVDGVTAAQYEERLAQNLDELLARFKSGRYRAPPVRRVYIPKGGRGAATRPIGIPTLEDKVLQRAVLMVLEPLWRELMAMGGGWIIDLDISRYFDTIDHRQLRTLLDQRVRDGVIRRALGKWMKAGVMESGTVHYPEAGTPQGGVISPLLSNLYLHEVLDQWFEQAVKPRLQGRAFMVRFADDAVLAFACEADARRVLAVLPKRLGKYGLQLHPDKTRLVEFRPFGEGPPGGRCFDLLGFTHYWGRSRKGRWIIQRKTAKGRLARAVYRVGQWCRLRRHRPVAEQHTALTRQLMGHYAYYGITGNARALWRFQRQVERSWRKWLSRRSNRSGMDWARFRRLLIRYPLPPPRVVHSIYRGAATR